MHSPMGVVFQYKVVKGLHAWKDYTDYFLFDIIYPVMMFLQVIPQLTGAF